MKPRVKVVGTAELGQCPCAVTLYDDGQTEYIVNRDVLFKLRHEEQLFLLAHEVGHVATGSSDERVADAFALGLTAGRQQCSLKNALSAVASMEVIPYERLAALYRQCLYTDRHRPR